LYVAKFLQVLASDVVRLLGQTVAEESVTYEEPVRPIRAEIAGKLLEIPGPIETPPVQLTDSEMARAVSVFESSAGYLMRHYPKSELFIVYIPAPVMAYQLDMEMIPVALEDGSVREYPLSRMELASDRVCQHIANVALRQDATFLDVRPAIRAAGQAQVIHGPSDWQHFNEIGYKILGSIVARRLSDGLNNLSKGKPGPEVSSKMPYCAKIGGYEQN
jgi:hypothetical protein